MSTMNRLFPAAALVLGSLLLSSCYQDPWGPPGRPYGDNGPYGDPYPQQPQPQGPYGDPNGPYGNPNGPQQPPAYDPYGNPLPRQAQQGIQDPQPGIQNPPGQTATTPPRLNPSDYPVAKKGKKPNEVISPYSPYNVIDVTGFKSGQMAKDPSNKKIFVVP
ncbi:MAG: hypothetical protein CFE44_03180 [Burkholderiales bacterium PBB4]|nr:MAG: hypothetical protein CFE44_03180 [Burkholderiales bacterium PBB4]